MFKKNCAALVLCLLTATAASAAISQKHKEWREGPVQWIMTPEEQRAWRKVTNDEEATAFIDLFWARRDPTPGTPENEGRAEFDGRVLLADQKYTEKKRRGAMTDRGRTAIVLGQPTTLSSEAVRANSSEHDVNSLGGTGRLTGGREEWFYDREAAKPWGIPSALVVFVMKPQTGQMMRDVQRTDFGAAVSGAIKTWIKNPDLTTVPDWAAHGGLNPYAFTIVPARTGETEAAAPAQADSSQLSSTPTRTTTTVTVPFEESFHATGISRLTLSRDIYEVDLQTKTDPFTKIASTEVFKASEELGWASQICTGSNDEPTVRFQLRITGTAAGEVVDRAAEPDEIVPDRIRALNGCYMIRGAVPLEGMAPGDYQLEVSVRNPASRTDTVLKKAFRIE